jgi:protein-S-isoprenylcysteine O-methyltransferase Ste14
MKTIFIALRAVAYMTGFFFFFGWLALRVRTWDQAFDASLPAWLEIPGLILAVAGIVLALYCVGEFITRGRGTPAPFDAPREFVAAGPYRFVRNPMYVGGISLLAGFALYIHSISVLLMSVILFFVAHLFVVLYEEPVLKKTFGATYETYCRSVSRWLPGRGGPADAHAKKAF